MGIRRFDNKKEKGFTHIDPARATTQLASAEVDEAILDADIQVGPPSAALSLDQVKELYPEAAKKAEAEAEAARKQEEGESTDPEGEKPAEEVKPAPTKPEEKEQKKGK